MSIADKYRGYFRIKKEFKEMFKDVDKAIEPFLEKRSHWRIKIRHTRAPPT